MDFQLTEEQKMLKQMVHDLAEKEFRPKIGELEETDGFLSQEDINKFAELGLIGLCMSEQYGGQGKSILEAVLVIEELARVGHIVAFPVFEATFGAARVIEMLGTEEQKQKYLPPVCRGETMLGIAMTEPEAGSALTDLKTKAVLDGDYYVVNGQKRWITLGGKGEAFVVLVRLTEEPGARGIGALIVDAGASGLTYGKQERLMGLHGHPVCDLIFEDCRVPRENLMHPAGRFRELLSTTNVERIGEAANALGIAQGAYEEALKYSQERKQFGKELCEFQAIQFMLADMALQLEAARLLLYKAAASSTPKGTNPLEAIMAKLACSQWGREVAASALQIHGGYGYSKEYPVERAMRDVWVWGIAGGTEQMNRIVIAQELLNRRFDQRK